VPVGFLPQNSRGRHYLMKVTTSLFRIFAQTVTPTFLLDLTLYFQ